MDWPNDLPSVTGIDRVIAEMAKRLIDGPLVYRSPFWVGEVTIKDLDDYRVWVRFVDRMDNERGSEKRALEIWEEEKIKYGYDPIFYT